MFKGAWALVKGISLLLSRAELRAVLWRMILLLLVLFAGLTWGVFELSTAIGERFIPTGDAWYIDFLAWLLSLFAMLLALVIGIVSFVTLGSIAVAPWLDELYVRVGRLYGAQLKQRVLPWWKSVGNSMWNSVMPLATFIPMAALAAVFLLVPIYGTIVATVVWSYASLKLLSFEFMDTPATFSGWKWPQRKAQVEGNRWFYMGFSGLAMFLLVIPGLNLFVLPAAVVALYPQMQGEDSVSDHTYFPEA
ncbi:MAG: EI24 domain-containing protein [Mariprofundaceae bacterium]|nr:EI24 domain-containing protein [Mariprofundaceae bacterium]